MKIQALEPCKHKEFDTRVILYAVHAAEKGCMKQLMLLNDTDVMVLAISNFARIGVDELWVSTFSVHSNTIHHTVY